MSRILAAFGLLLVLMAGPMPSFAQVAQACPGSTSTTTCDQGQAYLDCQSYTASLNLPNSPMTKCIVEGNAYRGQRCSAAGTSCGLQALHAWKTSCVASRPSVYAGYQGADEKVCFAGCEMGADTAPTERKRVDAPPSNAINFQRGRWVPTGNACSADSPGVPPPRDDYCANLAGGYKVCSDSKGRQCVISPKTGRKYCANNTDPMQATNPERTENVSKSPEATAPGIPSTPPTPRPGEDWRKTSEVSVTNVTNNTTNNTTISGNAGTPNTNPGDGNPGDGSGNPGEPEGGDDDEGSASGGADCETPPTCSGDPIACATLDQTWRNRCAADKGDKNGNGRPDWTELGEGEGDNGPEPGNGDEVAQTWGMESLLDKVDDSGFIGASCPAIPPLNLGPLGSFEVGGEWWCETLELIGGIFVFIASCGAIRILVS